MEEKMRDWSEMQPDISRLIASKLRYYPYRCKFASASKKWYHITKEEHGPFLENCPLLLLPRNYETQTCMFYNVFRSEMIEFNLPEIKGKFIHTCSNGWLVVMDESNFELSLINPLSGQNFQLPNPTSAIYPLRRAALCKLVVSEDCKMICGTTKHSRLVVYHSGDDSWTLVNNLGVKAKNVIFFEGNIYATRRDGGCVVKVDCSGLNFQSRCIQGPWTRISRGKWDMDLLPCYFVECSGDLLLVHQFGEINVPQFMKTKKILVHKFEKDRESWSRVHDLGDKSLFLGYNGSMCVSAGKIDGCRPNCIYFANVMDLPEDCFPTWFEFEHDNDVFSLEDNGVFSLEDGTVEMFNLSHSFAPWQSPAMWFQMKI